MSLDTSTPPLDAAPLGVDELAAGLDVAKELRVAVFVVAYNAEAHIESTLRRIPEALRPHLAAVYVIDDKSGDRTAEVARRVTDDLPDLEVYTTPFNQGYGGNQKLGYRYAIEKGYDVVVLLHGDGQYAPEVMPRLLAPFADPETGAVFGSRMMDPEAARRGGMPFYKRVGNRILTRLENRLLGQELSEFHSGYRAYRVSTLARLPFERNTDDFHFDTEIIIQLVLAGAAIREVPIPTYYGDEICHVNGIPYAWNCIRSVLTARANGVHLLFDPKYDVKGPDEAYLFKEAESSLHQYLMRYSWPRGARIVELGAGTGRLSRHFHDQGARVVAVDQRVPDGDHPFPFLAMDLDEDFEAPLLDALGGRADAVVALDVIEHLDEPEPAVERIARVLKPGGRLIASTGNVAFLLQRLNLMMGQFNYGKRGILDLTHRRLFTIKSFRRLLEQRGFTCGGARGFGPPIEDMVSDSTLFRALDRSASWFARFWPALFAYQFLIEARSREALDDILARTLRP